jgi:hypothetical protein
MKFVRTALVIAATFCVSAAPTLAGAAPNWPAAKIVVLPAGAKGVPQGYLPALSCASVGNCVAGGAYTNAKGISEGLLSNEIAGVWRSPITITPPSNAAANPGVTVYASACGGPGNCSAGGSYQETSGAIEGFLASEVGTVWRSAVQVPLPANAVSSGQNAQLHSIACVSPGNCSAVGTYSAKGTPLPTTQGLVINEVNGIWQKGDEVHLPGGTNVNPFVTLTQVACASAGNCSAVGSYTDNNGATHALLISEQASRWLAGTSMLLPGNASTFPDAFLSSVTCTTVGNCSAIGNYDNSSGDTEGLVTVESARAWKRATAMVMPAGAKPNPRVFFYGFNGISCSSTGNCSAGGQYTDASGHYQGFFVDEVNGSWQTADELKLPSGAQQAGKNGGVVALSCTTNGNCSAGAAYQDASGNYQALVINRVNGNWLTGTKVALPSGAASVGVDGGVYGLVCKNVNECTATGSYQQTSTVYEGFTISVN